MREKNYNEETGYIPVSFLKMKNWIIIVESQGPPCDSSLMLFFFYVLHRHASPHHVVVEG